MGSLSAAITSAIERWGQLNRAGQQCGCRPHHAAGGRHRHRHQRHVRPSRHRAQPAAHAALPHLRRSGGAIVNVSSTHGYRPNPVAADHGASEAALEQLTRTWAVELAADDIRVNAVAPGPTESEAVAAAGLPKPSSITPNSKRPPSSPWAAAPNPKRSPTGSCA
ncbi:SDR family oxidoreductase [Streptomyces sp. NBC_01003]|uniref:SDR family NAD(P)-dependent oxidoreductase n=1 Tax=Streptomyces sp. NBC_01003 TaxID=2903714 RepID=UPI00386503A9|nr:SDR family oxidoreductase [Streptomyces sp. NBC_01003]